MGLVVSNFLPLSPEIRSIDFGLYALYLLLFLIGISVGSDIKSWSVLFRMKSKIIWIPIATILGTLLGVWISHMIWHIDTLKNTFAIGAGFGYYSLSSIIIGSVSGEIAGTLALLSNIIRELITIVGAPWLTRFGGKLACIVSGGATSMDTSLPVISKHAGKEFVVISIVHGTILTILVPIIVSFILSV